MIFLDGLPALSAFRLERLNRDLHRRVPGARLRTAWHVYFVAAQAGATLDEQRLAGVLRARSVAPKDASLWVVPRLGTISPWSSKATDILRGCGFAVQRVERGMACVVDHAPAQDTELWPRLLGVLHDPMTQSVLTSLRQADTLFDAGAPAALQRIALGNDAQGALNEANRRLGLALAPDEIEYLAARYGELGRDPSDAELMMFAQANSEHCRHKVFNASWKIDGRDDQEHACGSTAVHPVGIPRQRRGDRGQPG